MACPELSILKIIPPNYIQLTPPSSANLRNGVCRGLQFSFKEVFNESVGQKRVFDTVALPSVENVLCGRNALIFTYGVTSSGKTYTMSGSPQNGGIMPRSLDVIFNSIRKYQAKKFIFKPDKLNGFDIQSESDAKIDRDQDLLLKLSSANKKVKDDKREFEADIISRIREDTKIMTLDEDNCYSVFITYVEIYNNSVYDLLEDLDENIRPQSLQQKIVREDSNHNMFVHGVNEIEVSTADEAFELYYKGQKRRRMAQTMLNSESSRSHSAFTIRIVQAPLEEDGKELCSDKSSMIVSQLSLVDLAGSERTNRTKNTGQRLREAGNINNSLLTLRTCLELLRENQNGANKMIPYRDSKLTHLFKTFLDGDGQVTMVICISPRVDEFDELMHVMKFAETSQEVQVAVSTPIKTACFTPGRRKAYHAYQQIMKESENKENEGGDKKDSDDKYFSSHWFSNLPDVRFIDICDDNILPNLIKNLEEGLDYMSKVKSSIKENCSEGRKKILVVQREAIMTSQELNTLKNLFDSEKEKVINLENKAVNSDTQLLKMKRKLDDYEVNVKRLKRELSEKDLLINKKKMETEKTKQDFAQKIAQTQERLNLDLERKLRSQRSALQYEMRNKEKKLKAVKKILASDDVSNFDQFAKPRLPESRSAESLVPKTPQTPVHSARTAANNATPSSTTPSSRDFRKMGVPVANRRHRRSRSAGDDFWLDHRPGAQIPLGTIMQPTMARRKSITKLTDAKDVTEVASKYCLLTHGQDSDGDIETRLYKGDVIPTSGGGAQVMFNDIEVLRQVSPTNSSPSKRPGENCQENCFSAVNSRRRHH